MKFIYVVFEDIDIDGGFGDAVATTETVCAFETEGEAKVYVEQNSKPTIYDRPYDDLYCGGLHYEAIPIGGPVEQEEEA